MPSRQKNKGNNFERVVAKHLSNVFGYNFERLNETLNSIGYSEVTQSEPIDYHIHEEPCLRVEAFKN